MIKSSLASLVLLFAFVGDELSPTQASNSTLLDPLAASSGRSASAVTSGAALPSYTKLIALDACDMDGNGIADCVNTGWTDGEVQSDVDPWLDTGTSDNNIGTATVADQTMYETGVAIFGVGIGSVGVYADGSDYALSDKTNSASAFMLATETDYSCALLVGTTDSTPGTSQIFNTGTTGTDNTVKLGTTDTTFTHAGNKGASTLWNYSIAVDWSTAHLFVWNYKGDDATTATDEIAVWADDMITAARDDELANKPAPGTVTRRLQSFRNQHASSGFYDGFVHFFYCWDTLLTQADRVSLKAYAEDVRGIPIP